MGPSMARKSGLWESGRRFHVFRKLKYAVQRATRTARIDQKPESNYYSSELRTEPHPHPQGIRMPDTKNMVMIDGNT
ncbi:MAG TPA: hypothetical protein P5133_14335, partial [Spirochaetia bacterium]|nr:hypothetical protein [Spirochaetia bacterium]